MNSLKIIRKLKKESQPSQGVIKIETFEGVKGYLRPVQARREDAVKMAKWRTENFDTFFTWIQPGENDVLQWLRRYENDDSDIVFIIDAPPGVSIGQMALYNINLHQYEAEFGRVIRGERVRGNGIMVLAAEALLQWAFASLELKKIFLQVFADNEPAIFFYKSLGFHVSNILFFIKTKTAEGIVHWIKVEEKCETSSVKDQYREVCKMTLKKEDLII